MQKLKLSLIIAGCFFSLQGAYAAKVEIDGETIDCDVKSFSHLTCEGQGKNKGKRTLVIMADDATVAIEQDATGMVKVNYVQKVSEKNKVLFQSDSISVKPEETKSTRAFAANWLIGLSDNSIPELEDYADRARGYLFREGSINSPVKVKFNNKEFQCEVGYREAVVQTGHKLKFDENMKCPLYGCNGKDGESAILHVPTFTGEYGNTNLVIMKNGNAQYVDSGFTVEDGSNIPVASGLKSEALELESRLGVHPDWLVPTGYKGDKKTFLYMTNVNKDAYLVHTQNLCAGKSSLKKLFEEQKTIGNKLTEISEQQKLVELVTAVDKTLRVTLVDREKGLKVGCLFLDKVYAGESNLNMAETLYNQTGPNQIDKYLTEEEMQKLYKEVSFIPAGNSGLRSGAEARAHMISNSLKKRGIEHNKIWVKGNLQRYWNSNVAVYVNVKNKNGEIVKYVIDPATQQEAVSEISWLAKMSKNNSDPYSVTTYPIAENTSNFHRNVIAYSSPDMYGFDYEEISEKEKTKRAYKDFLDESNKNHAQQFE